MKHARSILLMLSIVVMFAAVPAWGDYINQPIKWSQPIGFEADGSIQGVDLPSDHIAAAGEVGVVVADDFICNDQDPIVAVRWWGSYIGEDTQRDDGFTGPFDISFHLSVPGSADEPHPYSLPGNQVYFATVSSVQEVFVGRDVNEEPVYRYDAYLDDPFDQWQYSQSSDNGILGELWIDICKPTGENWGWHESAAPHPTLDFAAESLGHGGIGSWTTTFDETDVAFELMTIPEPATMSLLAIGGVIALIRRRRS